MPRLLLCLALPSACRAEITVINAGIPGENSAEVATRLDPMLKRYTPRYVVLFVGMNDAVNDKKFLTPETTEQHVRSMISQASHSGASVVLVSIHVPDTARLLERHKVEVYGGISPAQRVRNLDQLLVRTAREDHASLADFHSALNQAGGPTPEWSTDGVHLTAKGYELLAQVVRSALPEHLPDGATVVCLGDSLTYGIGVRPAGGTEESDKTYPAVLRRLLNKDSRMLR